MDINQIIERLVAFYDSGRNPMELMNNFQGGNINTTKQQIMNMAQGRSPAEFIMQLAKQNGATEKNLQGLARILGAK